MNTKALTTIVAIVIIIALMGELMLYYVDVNNHDSDAEWTADGINYSISSSGNEEYSVTALCNTDHISEVYLYSDPDYSKSCYDANVPNIISQNDRNRELENRLRCAGYHDELETIPSGDALLERLTTDLEKDVSKTKALIISTPVLPSTVYSCSDEDPLIKWAESGGTICWIGCEVGGYFSDESGTHKAENNQILFFGVTCQSTNGTYYADRATCDLTKMLHMTNTVLDYGVDPTGVTDSLALGYSDGDLTTTFIHKMGLGKICVFSGKYHYTQSEDVAKIISAGISYDTTVVENQSGTFFGSTTGTLPTADSVFIALGGYYLKYSESHWRS